MNPAENYILNQSEPYKSILLHLQLFIEQCVPNAELLYKWKVPFYYVEKRPFCYLNQTKDYVDLGFWNSAHLTVHLEHMVSESRKTIRSLRYRSIEDINENIIVDILNDAYAVRNKRFYKP